MNKRKITRGKRSTLDKLPPWTESAMQALAFWVGYKREFFPHYHLQEAAVVSQLLDILYAKVPEAVKVVAEAPVYTGHTSRADIVLRMNENVTHIIEVKNEHKGYSLSKKLVIQDMKRLKIYKDEHPQVSCYLLLVSQSKLPKLFVSREGLAKTIEKNALPVACSVRRVCKAAASFKRPSNAYYVSLVEIH